jgi:cell shape-determining protein MreD
MRLYILYVLLGVALLGIQAHPLLPFAQQGIRPDLVLILVLYLGTRPELELGAGAVLVSLLGYFCAVFSGGPFGLYAFVYLFFFVSIDLLKTVFDLRSIYFQILLVVFGSFLEGVLVFLLCWVFHNSPHLLVTVKTILPKQLAFTVAVAPVVLLVLNYIIDCVSQNTPINLFRGFFQQSSVKTAAS